MRLNLSRCCPGYACVQIFAMLVGERVVLDTSLFVNPDVRSGFGASPTEAYIKFLELAQSIQQTVKFYMPPSVIGELAHFVKFEEVPPQWRFIVIRKPPKKLEVNVPAYLLYELINDVRRRIDRGLRVAEEALRGRGMVAVTGDQLATLRGNYRKALREGIIDSTEDVDLVLLSRELDALLVSADQGVVTFADKLGVRWIDAVEFRNFMDSMAGQGQSG